MDHLDDLNKLVIELEAIDVKISEGDKAILYLVSLPSLYTLIHRKDTMGFDVVVATFISHDSMRKKEKRKDLCCGAMIASHEGQVKGWRAERQGLYL